MTDPVLPPTPAWIRRSDGEVVPFEPHIISQSLFAATEDLGQPNAFLARELTDSVIHFFAQETGAATATTEQLADLIEKVVRELGQPALAKGYAERRQRERAAQPTSPTELIWESRFPAHAGPREVVRATLSEYSLRAVYSADLAAAHREGLLVLADLDQPARMRAAMVEAWGQEGLGQAELHRLLLEAQTRAGSQIVIDSPEHWFEDGSVDAAKRFWQTIACHVSGHGSQSFFIHLNALPPPRKERSSPLFHAAESTASVPAESSLWAESFLTHRAPGIELHWHVGKHQDLPKAPPAWFEAWAQQPGSWPTVRFVVYRARQVIRLGEGMQRGQAGVLGLVGLNLPRLATWPGIEGDATKLLARLPSLARMGVAAGVQRRHFLRRQPGLQAGFLTERAPWLVSPIGLDATVQAFLGVGLAASPVSLDLGVQIVQTLKAGLEHEARHAHLDVILNGGTGAENTSPGQAWGLTASDAAASAQQQIHAAGALHQAAGSGTAFVKCPPDPPPTAAELWQCLLAAAKAEVCRLGFVVR